MAVAGPEERAVGNTAARNAQHQHAQLAAPECAEGRTGVPSGRTGMRRGPHRNAKRPHRNAQRAAPECAEGRTGMGARPHRDS